MKEGEEAGSHQDGLPVAPETFCCAWVCGMDLRTWFYHNLVYYLVHRIACPFEAIPNKKADIHPHRLPKGSSSQPDRDCRRLPKHHRSHRGGHDLIRCLHRNCDRGVVSAVTL